MPSPKHPNNTPTRSNATGPDENIVISPGSWPTAVDALRDNFGKKRNEEFTDCERKGRGGPVGSRVADQQGGEAVVEHQAAVRARVADRLGDGVDAPPDPARWRRRPFVRLAGVLVGRAMAGRPDGIGRAVDRGGAAAENGENGEQRRQHERPRTAHGERAMAPGGGREARRGRLS